MSKQENVLSAMFKYVSVSVFITTISNAKWKDTMFPYVKSSRSQYKNPSRCTPSTPSSFSTRDRVGSVTRNCAGPVDGFWRNFYLLSLGWILLKLWRPRGKRKGLIWIWKVSRCPFEKPGVWADGYLGQILQANRVKRTTSLLTIFINCFVWVSKNDFDVLVPIHVLVTKQDSRPSSTNSQPLWYPWI